VQVVPAQDEPALVASSHQFRFPIAAGLPVAMVRRESTPEVPIDRRLSEKNIYAVAHDSLIRVRHFVESAHARSYLVTAHNWPNVLELGTMKLNNRRTEHLTSDRRSNRFNRLIELELATRRFIGFGVIYHTCGEAGLALVDADLHRLDR